MASKMSGEASTSRKSRRCGKSPAASKGASDGDDILRNEDTPSPDDTGSRDGQSRPTDDLEIDLDLDDDDRIPSRNDTRRPAPYHRLALVTLVALVLVTALCLHLEFPYLDPLDPSSGLTMDQAVEPSAAPAPEPHPPIAGGEPAPTAPPPAARGTDALAEVPAPVPSAAPKPAPKPPLVSPAHRLVKRDAAPTREEAGMAPAECTRAYRLLSSACAGPGLCIKDMDRWKGNSVREYRRLSELVPNRISNFNALCWRACQGGGVSRTMFDKRFCTAAPLPDAMPQETPAKRGNRKEQQVHNPAPPARKPMGQPQPVLAFPHGAKTSNGEPLVLTVGQSTLAHTLRSLGPARQDHRWPDNTRELTYRFAENRVLLDHLGTVDGITLWFDPAGVLKAIHSTDAVINAVQMLDTVTVLPTRIGG